MPIARPQPKIAFLVSANALLAKALLIAAQYLILRMANVGIQLIDLLYDSD